MIIRKATIKDLKAITAVEATCFPPAEAASRSNFKKRLKTYPNHFWLLEDEGKLISFINGMVTNETTINDIMFEDASLHDEAGEWQAIFGVNTIPEYRQQGLAAKVMQVVIDDARMAGRKGCILTCKDKLLHYYEKFGFKNCGISQSMHGGSIWYDMRLEFEHE